MVFSHVDRWRPPAGPRRAGRAWARPLARGAFLRGAAGAGAALALAGSAWVPTVGAAPPGPGEPRPIPNGFSVGGTLLHVEAPTLLGFPADAEPGTIYDFDGFVGIAFIQGAGTATDTATGRSERLLFDVDMRFQQGAYVALDGSHREGTFGFI
jgi:hypothetical protein